VVGQWEGRRAGSRVYSANPEVNVASPSLVLVGPNTEGVGEILADALKRNGAVLVGQRTFGHAPYMSLVKNGEIAVWMPVGLRLRNDGEPITGNGIEPDDSVEITDPEAPGDPVLDRALEIISQESEMAA